MISNTFGTLIFDPLYNVLVFLIATLPFADVGIAVILLTVLVKVFLLPLAYKAAKTQAIMRRINPLLQESQKKHKNDKQKQAQKAMEIYRAHDIHPLSGLLVLFIQLPIIIGLYWVFLRGGLPVIDTTLLYSFVPHPGEVNMIFLGVVDMGGKSIVLAALAGISQFVYAYIAMPAPEQAGGGMKDDIARTMHFQMRYVLPVFIAVFAYTISAAVALYWVTGNVFSIAQEMVFKKKIEKEREEKVCGEKERNAALRHT